MRRLLSPLLRSYGRESQSDAAWSIFHRWFSITTIHYAASEWLHRPWLPSRPSRDDPSEPLLGSGCDEGTGKPGAEEIVSTPSGGVDSSRSFGRGSAGSARDTGCGNGRCGFCATGDSGRGRDDGFLACATAGGGGSAPRDGDRAGGSGRDDFTVWGCIINATRI